MRFPHQAWLRCFPAPASLHAGGVDCPRCDHANDIAARRCEACGASLLATLAASGLPLAAAAGNAPRVAPPGRLQRLDPGLRFWLIGLVGGLLWLWLPFLPIMLWFLSALVHEMGHCAGGWFFGCPGFPAINIGTGHAVAVHQGQSTGLVLLIWAGLGGLAWSLRGQPLWRWLALALALLYPLLAFVTPLREFLFLAGGHGGELVFAAIFLWRAWTGAVIQDPLERPLYAVLGFALWWSTLGLFWGLTTSSSARGRYFESGSYGLTNDLIRIAQEHLGWYLSSTALLFLLATLAMPIALGLVAWRRGRTAT